MEVGSVLEEHMAKVDPVHGHSLEENELQIVYDSLLECSSCNQWSLPYMSSKLVVDSNLHAVEVCLEEQMDLYRAIIVVSFLLLQLKDLENDQVKARALETTIERCFWLLRCLTASSCDYALPQRVSVSRFSLLNALLDEPLIPLSRRERHELWQASRSPIDVPESNQTLALPSRHQLEREERELVKMTQKPISECLKTLGLARILPYDTLARGPVDCQSSNEGPSKISSLVVIRCGILCLEREGAENMVYMLSPATSIGSSADAKGFIVLLSDVSILTKGSAPSIGPISFRVETLKDGARWMKALQVAHEHVQVASKTRTDMLQEWEGT